MLKRKKLLSVLAIALACTANNMIAPSPVLATEVTGEIKSTVEENSFDILTNPIQQQVDRLKAEGNRQEKLKKAELARDEADRLFDQQRKDELARVEAKVAQREAERLEKVRKELEAKGTDEKRKAEILKGTESLDKLRGTSECREFVLTFYTSLASENGNSLEVNCHGQHLADGMIASNCLPQGTKLFLEGMGNFEVADTGAQQYFSAENRIDIFVPRVDGETDEEYSARATSYGVKHVYGYVLNDSSLKVISDKLPPSAPVLEQKQDTVKKADVDVTMKINEPVNTESKVISAKDIEQATSQQIEESKISPVVKTVNK